MYAYSILPITFHSLKLKLGTSKINNLMTDYIIFYKYFGLVFHKLLVLFLKYKTK